MRFSNKEQFLGPCHSLAKELNFWGPCKSRTNDTPVNDLQVSNKVARFVGPCHSLTKDSSLLKFVTGLVIELQIYRIIELVP